MNRGRAALFRCIPVVCAAIVAVAASPADAASRNRALEDALRGHIQVLASDNFEGREPGTEGEARTLRYLAKQWFDIGLVSGTNDPGNEWFAPVTLVAREPASSSAQFMRKGRGLYLAGDSILVLTSGRRSLLRQAPLLFVGKRDVDALGRNVLAGRIAVLLDGGVADSKRQNALLAAGASAVLTVLDGDRTLENVAARRQRTGYALADEDIGGDLEAFITRPAMERLLKASGEKLASMEAAADDPDFTPRMLDLSATLEATTRETTIKTYNLIGKIPGRKQDAGAVLLLAHWDGFGICGEPSAEDRICNGAIDNASGVAALTEIARRLTRGPQMDRDVYFVATTSEELGLLGAYSFAENPPLPLDHFIAAFNIDSMAIAPRGAPLVIVGRGMTALDPQIEAVAKHEKRKLLSSDDANAYVRRQDGWALLQHDIPAVMVTSAYSDLDRMEAFFDGDYHRPSDDLKRRIELGGEAQDVLFHVALVRWFADTRRVPSPER